MGQHQSRYSFSIGTRLLLGVLSLIVVVVVFLNVSAIFLLREDKQTSVLRTKSTEALLAGTEFASTARHVVGALRMALAAPSAGTTGRSSSLQNLVDGQSDAFLIAVGRLNTHTGKLLPLSWAARQKREREWAAISRPDDLPIREEWVTTVLPELKKSSLAFLNLSREDGKPVLAVLLADMSRAALFVEVPVAVGLVSLSEFATSLAGLDLTIATRQGWVVYDSDPTVLYSRSNISKDPFFSHAVGQEKLKQGSFQYEAGGHKYLGSYFSPGMDLLVMSRADWDESMQSTYALSERLMLLGLMAVAFAIVFAIFFARGLIAPIKRLVKATREVANGNFNVSAQDESKDEVGTLAQAFNLMSTKIRELFAESVEKVLLESELDIASTVQQNLLPPSVYKSDGVDIYSYYQAASRCGGDWWGVFNVGSKVVIGVADATGHGLQCALMTATARSSFSVLNKLAEENPNFAFSPSEMLGYCNRAVYESCTGKIMMTFFIGVIDLDRMVLTYANAGHNPPWLFHKNESEWQLKSLIGVGARLGERLNTPRFDEKSVPLTKNDILFLYTDGLMETKADDTHVYGKKRMRTLVEAGLEKGADQVVDGLIADFLRFNEGKYLDDDVTVAAVSIHGISGPLVSVDVVNG